MVLLLVATADRTFRKGIKTFKKESSLQVRGSSFFSGPRLSFFSGPRLSSWYRVSAQKRWRKRVRVLLFLVHNYNLSFFSLWEDTFGRNKLEGIHRCRLVSKVTRDLRERTKLQGAYCG